MGRLKLLFAVCLRILRDNEFAAQVRALHSGGLVPPAEAAAPALPDNCSMIQGVQLLAILQREGRFIDFLQESLDSYSDAQVGAAVRSVHEGCRRAVDEYVLLEPVRGEAEGDTIEVAADFDPSALHLTGEPSGEPPYRGVLKHHGWRAGKHSLPPLPAGQDPHIIQPAEVEV